MSDEVRLLAEDYFALRQDVDPVGLSVFGFDGTAARLPDLDAAVQAEQASRLRRVEQQASALSTAALSHEDAVTVGVLRHEAASTAAALEDGLVELSVTGPGSPHAALLFTIPKTDPGSADAEASYLTRLHGVDGYLVAASGRFREASRRGRVPTQRALTQAIGQLDAYLSSPADPITAPFPGSAAVAEAVVKQVRPALAAYRQALDQELMPVARSDDRCGLVHVPGGADVYAHAVAHHTTTDRSPEHLHQLGLELCADLREQYAELGDRVFGLCDVDAVVERLRHDPSLRYQSRQQIETDARNALARAEQALPNWFDRWHQSGCEVLAISDLEAPDAVLGYYQPPSAATGRPGRHWINTWQPQTRTRYEYEALAFHEGVPGHHLQLARAQELDLPAFRRFGYVAAFSEGWALYAERLADEMGLYSSDLARFGMLSFDSWRAARLVVDTGIHALGWSRQRAIDFMLTHTALTPDNIANEVDRYITWPGQALSYMTGRLEIDRLRQDASLALGPCFDIKAFHSTLLDNGSLPLSVLADVVARWTRSLSEQP